MPGSGRRHIGSLCKIWELEASFSKSAIACAPPWPMSWLRMAADFPASRRLGRRRCWRAWRRSTCANLCCPISAKWLAQEEQQGSLQPDQASETIAWLLAPRAAIKLGDELQIEQAFGAIDAMVGVIRDGDLSTTGWPAHRLFPGVVKERADA